MKKGKGRGRDAVLNVMPFGKLTVFNWKKSFVGSRSFFMNTKRKSGAAEKIKVSLPVQCRPGHSFCRACEPGGGAISSNLCCVANIWPTLAHHRALTPGSNTVTGLNGANWIIWSLMSTWRKVGNI